MPQFEYRHHYIDADTKGTGYLRNYPFEKVKEELDKFGKDNWELVHKEADWGWREPPTIVEMVMAWEVASRRFIRGWFVTFRRETSTTVHISGKEGFVKVEGRNMQPLSFTRDHNKRITGIYADDGRQKVLSIVYDSQGGIRAVYPGNAAGLVNLVFS